MNNTYSNYDRDAAILNFSAGRHGELLDKTKQFKQTMNNALPTSDYQESIINTFNNRPISNLPNMQNKMNAKSTMYLEQE